MRAFPYRSTPQPGPDPYPATSAVHTATATLKVATAIHVRYTTRSGPATPHPLHPTDVFNASQQLILFLVKIFVILFF